MAMGLMRSKLFVPASRPELFAKALAGEADAISIDLEDAVQESRKAEARETVAAFLRHMPPTMIEKTMIVRINGLATPHFAADVAAIAWHSLDMLNLPKPESAEDICTVAAALTRFEAERGIEEPIRILANIESPRGLRNAAEIACADPRVAGLQIGFGDLFEALGIDRTDAQAIHQVQLQVRFAAGEAGIWAYDAAFAAVGDPEGYRREAEGARRLGYLGKTCIHPSQIAIANDVFRPGDAEIAHALKVVGAWRDAQAKGVGAFMVDGKMIDAPFAKRAEDIIAAARRLKLIA